MLILELLSNIDTEPLAAATFAIPLYGIAFAVYYMLRRFADDENAVAVGSKTDDEIYGFSCAGDDDDGGAYSEQFATPTKNVAFYGTPAHHGHESDSEDPGSAVKRRRIPTSEFRLRRSTRKRQPAPKLKSPFRQL